MANTSIVNILMTLSFASFLIFCKYAWSSLRSFLIISPHYSSFGGLKNPVLPLSIDSSGPPELHATTMHPMYIASTGTIPKCSFSGVYRRISVFDNSSSLSSFDIDFKNTILSSISNFLASYLSSFSCSTFSATLMSYPPATTSRASLF